MKNIMTEPVFFIVSIVVVLASFIFYYFKNKDEKIYLKILTSLSHGVSVLVGLFLLKWIIKLENEPIFINTLIVMWLAGMFLFYSTKKRTWWTNALLTLGFGALAFNVQYFIIVSLKNVNVVVEDKSKSIEIERDMEKQRKLNEHWTYEEQRVMDDFHDITKSIHSTNKSEVYFQEFIKYKDTVCSSNLNSDEKKMNLISFKTQNIKNVMEYADGTEEIGLLLDRMSMDLGYIKEYQDQYSDKNNYERTNKYDSFTYKIQEYIDAYDDCKYKNLNSKSFLDEYIKSHKIVEGVEKSASKIMMK